VRRPGGPLIPIDPGLYLLALLLTELKSDWGSASGRTAQTWVLNEEQVVDDQLYQKAKEAVIKARKASTSYLQRKFGIGYSRAAHLLDRLEEEDVVGPGEGP
jgi:DNA segregation ATPase FtsK/SpoIIIE-like protein